MPDLHSIVLTAQTLRHALECDRRVWLDAYGEREEPSPDAHSWAEGVAITRGLMHQGAPVILGACLEVQVPLDETDRLFTLRAGIDRLIRLNWHGRTIYAPIEVRSRTRPEDADVLQLDYDAWLLSLIQNSSPPPGELWLGANDLGQPRTRLPHDYDEERLMRALSTVVEILDRPAEPPVRIDDYCKTCPWYTACVTIARQEGHLELLYAIPRATRDNMRRAGLVTLADVAAAGVEDLRKVKGIGPNNAPKIHANARAWVENGPVWHGTLPDRCRQPGWMFDLETHEVNGKTVPWCMGWCDVDGQTHIALVAPVELPETLALSDGLTVTLTPDSDSAWEVFADALSGTDSPIYHWTGYDAALLRGSAPAGVVACLLPRMCDLHVALKQSVSLPLKSTSIKVVSVYLGFPWPGHNDYRAAYVDYLYWRDEGNREALIRACTYQRADVVSMAWVWRWLASGEAPQQKL